MDMRGNEWSLAQMRCVGTSSVHSVKTPKGRMASLPLDCKFPEGRGLF